MTTSENINDDKEEVVEVVKDDKSTALDIFKDLKEVSKQVLDLVNRLKSQVSAKELETDNGISLLDVKNQMMIQYLLNLSQVIILKTTGKPLQGESALDRLIELRVVLERVNPLEQKLRYQIDKFIKIAISGSVDEKDPSRFRAHPADMMSKDENSDDSYCSGSDEDEEAKPKKEENRSNLYVPPKLAAVPYDGDDNQAERKQKQYDRARKQALRSSVIQELKEEYLDIPVEVKATNTVKQREDKYQQMKKEYEENYYTRLPVTKEEKKRADAIASMGRLGDDITHFEDTSILHGGTSYLDQKKGKKGKRKGKKIRGNFRKKRRN